MDIENMNICGCSCEVKCDSCECGDDNINKVEQSKVGYCDDDKDCSYKVKCFDCKCEGGQDGC